MKLDLSAFRYLSNDDFRVLTAIEMGMRNHEIVPVDLIESIAKLKKVSTSRVIANLLKHKLIGHTNIQYDGYVLNYMGYDYLAIHTLMRRGILVKIGAKLGVGKESDVYICYVNAKNVDQLENDKIPEISDEEYNKLKQRFLEDEINTESKNQGSKKSNVDEEDEEEDEEDDEEDEGNIDKSEISDLSDNFINDADNMMNKFEEELKVLDVSCNIAVIKLARLGRTSFRAVKTKRDYVKSKSHYNWLYLSRLSATNEFKYLTGLYENKFSVPRPYGHNRHAIVMQYIPSYTLCKIEDLGDKERAYNELIGMIIEMANRGLIHGDFNEFNILVELNTQKMYMIDFPQMISLAHKDAENYFIRDIKCINKFFYKKFGMIFKNELENVNFKYLVKRIDYLDVALKAYGHEILLAEVNKENKEKIKIEKNRLANLDDDDEELLTPDDEVVNTEIKDDKPKEDLELDYEKEIKDFKYNHEEKIVVDSDEIKNKVKRLVLKQIKKGQSHKTNRFKGKKNQKIDA